MTDLDKLPNYDKITNFLYEEDELFSKMLVDIYQQYIFNIKTIKSKIYIDEIMGLYIDKSNFYEFVRNNLSIDKLYNPYEKVIKELKELYKKYEEDKLKKVNNARWL